MHIDKLRKFLTQLETLYNINYLYFTPEVNKTQRQNCLLVVDSVAFVELLPSQTVLLFLAFARKTLLDDYEVSEIGLHTGRKVGFRASYGS